MNIYFYYFIFLGGGVGDIMTLWAFWEGHRKPGLFLGVISKFKV